MNIEDLLRTVNDEYNGRIRYVTEEKNYWQTLDETLQRGAGDCDDFAIAKYQALKQAGVPASQLRLAHVRKGLDYQHMVVVYTPTGKINDGYVLDNIDKRVRPLSERTSFQVLYSLNDDGLYIEDRRIGPATQDSRAQRALGLQNV